MKPYVLINLKNHHAVIDEFDSLAEAFKRQFELNIPHIRVERRLDMTQAELLARVGELHEQENKIQEELESLYAKLAPMCPIPVDTQLVGRSWNATRDVRGFVAEVGFNENGYRVYVKKYRKDGQVATNGHDWVRVTPDGKLKGWNNWRVAEQEPD